MLYTSLTTRNLSCTSFPFRVSSASFLWFPSVTPALSRTTCATHFLALPATADRALAMDAGCGSSTRGRWDGPGTCNESQRVAAREAAWRKVPCEHPASPCLGPAIVGSGRAATIPLGSSGSASPILTLGRICGSAASVPLSCGGANTVLNACFGGV